MKHTRTVGKVKGETRYYRAAVAYSPRSPEFIGYDTVNSNTSTAAYQMMMIDGL